jgi:hypothetical protein
MQSCPVEIWEAILTQLPSCYPDSKDFGSRRGLTGLLACALTCRDFSDIARPRVFKKVMIYNELRGKTLLELLKLKPHVTRWIQDVCIKASAREHAQNWFPYWLTTPDGKALISLLTHARALRVRHFRLMDSFNTTQFTVPGAWQTLRTLTSITVLDLGWCDIPTLQVALELFTDTFPALRELLLDSVHVQLSANLILRVRDGAPVSYGPACKLTDLSFRTCCHDYLNDALRQIDLSTLIRLEVTPADIQHNGHYSFSYVQVLLEHAPQLEQLTLTRCVRATTPHPGAFDFTINSRLWRIVFEGVKGAANSDPSWYADLLNTLPRITQLRFLKFSGELETIYDRAWLLLDETLSYPELCNSPGERNLVLEHKLEAISAKGMETVSSAYDFPQELLSKTMALGAFKVEWPTPFSSL